MDVMDSVVRGLRKQRGYHRQSAGIAPVPNWLAVESPNGVGEVARVLRQRVPRSTAVARVVAITTDGSPDVAGFGLTIAARMACADRGVRWRFRRRMWWLRAGPRAVDAASMTVMRHEHNEQLAGAQMPFTPRGWSEDENWVLAMYRRMLVVVDDVRCAPSVLRHLTERTDWYRRPEARNRRHVFLMTTVDPETVPDEAHVVSIDVVGIERAVREAVAAQAMTLPPGGVDRLAELGVFAGGAQIPADLIRVLWRVTAGMADADTDMLCRHMAAAALIDLDTGGLRLDPAIRAVGRLQLGPARLAELNAALLDALAADLPPATALVGTAPERAWWQMDAGAGYCWDHVVSHLLDAGRLEQARWLAGDLRWVAGRLTRAGAVAPYRDLTLAATADDDLADLADRRAGLAEAAEFLAPTEPRPAVADVLLDRLRHHPTWGAHVHAMHAVTDRPILYRRSPDRQLDEPVDYPVRAIDVDLSPTGKVLAVVWGGSSVTLINLVTRTTRYLSGRRQERFVDVGFSPDGSWLAALAVNESGGWGAEDPPAFTYLYVWDARKRNQRLRVQGWYQHQLRSWAASRDSTWLLTRGEDRDRAWNARTGAELPTIPDGAGPGRSALRTETVSPDGRWRATVDRNEVRLWDRRHDRPGPMMRLTPHRYSQLNGTLWLPDGDLLAYGDGGVYVLTIQEHVSRLPAST
jgi:hypothetical protein